MARPAAKKAETVTVEMKPLRVPRVLTALLAIQSEFSKIGIAKTHRNTQQNYDFRGIDDVMQALSGLLTQYSLIIQCEYDDRESQERVMARSGSSVIYTRLRGNYTFRCGLDNSIYGPVTAYGEGMDSGDKSTNKAMSDAYKYMAFQNFCIPIAGVGLDSEATGATPEDTRPKVDAPAAVEAPRPLDDKYSKAPREDAVSVVDIIVADLEKRMKGCTSVATGKEMLEQHIKPRVQEAQLSDEDRVVIREKANAALTALKERVARKESAVAA